MNFIDLCAGIGGIRLGLEQAGHTCVGFCEFDKFALQSYKAIHNTEGEWEAHDITKVTDDEIRELSATRTIDIVCGGFPCQAFSIAGKRRGFADTRGTIFFEVARFISIIRPRYFICENVKGLLSHDKGRTFATILSTLSELGYYVEWQVLNSKGFGVPQNRERVFLIGHLGTTSGRAVFPVAGADGENPCKLQEITHGVADAYRVYDHNGLARTLKSEGGGLGAKTGLYTNSSNVVITGIDLTTNNPKQTEIARCIQARYNKGYSTREAECTGVMISYVSPPGKDGVSIIQRAHGFNTGGEKGLAPAVTANSYHENNLLKQHIRIRKLTPRECWRLQGFPDEYFDRAKAAGISDTQLYKQAGNAVTVNVARVIGERLKEIEGD